jgi:hypothetical protein
LIAVPLGREFRFGFAWAKIDALAVIALRLNGDCGRSHRGLARRYCMFLVGAAL